MAVAFNIAAQQTNTSVNTVNTAVTPGAGANIAAVIQVEWRDSLASINPSAVASVALTGFSAATFVQLTGNTVGTLVETYVCTAGTAGAQTATVTWDDGFGTSQVVATVGVQVFNNVNQATPIGALNVGNATGTAVSVTVTGTIAGSMVANGVTYDNQALATANVGGGATSDWNTIAGTVGAGRLRNLGSHIASGGGNVSMTWTLSAARAWASSVVEVLEASTTALRDPILSPGLVPFPR